MDVIAIGREALRLVRVNKVLWLFGIFAAGSAAGGGGGAPGRLEPLPAWGPALIALALVLGGAALWLHVVSEGALIEGASRARSGGRLHARDGLTAGRACFARVLWLKVAALAALAAAALSLAWPALLAWRQALPAGVAFALSALLFLAALPWLLTGYFVYAYALRFAVLDGLDPRAAARAAWTFLRGRVLESVKLMVLAFTGYLGAAVATGLLVVPAAVLGAGVFLLTGSGLLAAAVGGALAVPPAIAVAGALGTFRSAVWTLGFLDSRAAERP